MNFIPLTHTQYVAFCLNLPITVPVSDFTVSYFIFLTLTPNIPQNFSIGSIQCIRYTALLLICVAMQLRSTDNEVTLCVGALLWFRGNLT